MVTMNYATGANTLLLMIRSAALALTASLSIPLLLGGGVAYATELSQPEETRLSVEYDGERHFLVRKLSGAEIRELVSDNTLIFIHLRGEECLLRPLGSFLSLRIHLVVRLGGFDQSEEKVSVIHRR